MGREAPSDNECRYLRSLLDAMDVAVLVADDDGVYVDANRAACRLLNTTREELIGRSLTEVVDPARAADVRAQWAAFLRDGAQSGVFELRLADGTARRVSFHARANFVPGRHCSFLTLLPETGDVAGDDEPLTLCAWTKRVKDGDEWVPVEEYLARQHGVMVSHGLSPAALEDLGDQF